MKLIWLCAICLSLFVLGCTEDEQVTFRLLSDLVPLRVSVSVLVSHSGGGVNALYRVKGDALLSINLAQAKVDADHNLKKVTITDLPEPMVVSPNAEFAKRIVLEKGLFTPDRKVGQIDNELLKKAQAQIVKMSSTDEMKALARAQAKETLIAYYEGFGYEASVKFK